MTQIWAGKEVWGASIFNSTVAAGNPTGMVISDFPPKANEAFRLAGLLGFPDTAFISPLDTGSWRVDTYSPAEPISFCVQTLLACQVVLSEHAALNCDHSFSVGEQSFETLHDADWPAR